MRQWTCQFVRRCFVVGGILLLTLPSASARETTSGSDSAQVPVQESPGGGPRYSLASQEFENGRRLASASDARCVDWYFSSARLCWQDLTEGLSQQPPRLYHGSLRLYNTALFACVIAGHQLGRLDPAEGLKISLDEGFHTIPVVSVGLNWHLDQIDCLRPAGICFQNPNFAGTVTFGVGTSLLGMHYRRENLPGEEHYLEEHPIALTAVLKGGGPLESYRLEFHNPIPKRTISVAGREMALSRNIAAAVEYLVTHLEAEVDPWTSFFNPEIALAYEGTLLLEPYQPGKIPVVLVHGLLSNPATWGALINDVWNNPELMERFQIWAYLYPTSVPMIQTASELRKDLRRTLGFVDPSGQDPALARMVLVGHSMGGLLSRLQVTWSCDYLWNEFANAPFAQVRGSDELRRRLSELFFFSPQPFVKRIVFIAVPHRGSSMSSRLLGLFGRLLAGRPTALQMIWREFTQLNPGVLRTWLRFGLPSSVDGLAPNSPTLRGIARLPMAPDVRLHSIIGTGGCEPCCPGDGIVSVESARLAGVDSELFVDATHSMVHEHPHAIQEVERILWIHWAEYQRQAPNTPSPETILPEIVPAIPVPIPAE